jgi:hypothetical protein
VADFGRRSQGGESLDAIARTDQLLDAIANERHVPAADAGEAELFGLLAGWRDEIRWPPATDLVSERDAAAALRDGVNSMPTRRGGHRGLTIVASLAAAVLCIGGFGAVVSGAGPGDPLYGLRTALLGEPQQVRDDRVALAAKQEMQQVQTLIDSGDWQQAQQKLATVSDSVKTVDDTGTKQQLIDQWNQLAVKVDQQNPAATVPPSAAPGPLEQLTLPSMPSLPETDPGLPSTVPSPPDFSVPTFPSGIPSMTEPFPSFPSVSFPPVDAVPVAAGVTVVGPLAAADDQRSGANGHHDSPGGTVELGAGHHAVGGDDDYVSARHDNGGADHHGTVIAVAGRHHHDVGAGHDNPGAEFGSHHHDNHNANSRRGSARRGIPER